MKKKKRYLFLVVAMLIMCSMSSLTANAASKSTTAWKQAYLKTINKLNKESGASSYKYDLIYFNKDIIPELVVGESGCCVSMYTYSPAKKKVYTLMDRKIYGAGGNLGYSYLPKKNILYNLCNSSAGAVQYLTYMTMKNNKLVSKYAKELCVKRFVDKNKNGYPDPGEMTDKPIYYYGNKKISKSKFESMEVKGNYQMIQGSVSYKEMKARLSTE